MAWKVERGVPLHAFKDGADWMADQLYNFMLLEVKARKELGLHLLSSADKGKQRKEANLLNNINCVTSGNFFFVIKISQYLASVFSSDIYYRFICKCRRSPVP